MECREARPLYAVLEQTVIEIQCRGQRCPYQIISHEKVGFGKLRMPLGVGLQLLGISQWTDSQHFRVGRRNRDRVGLGLVAASRNQQAAMVQATKQKPMAAEL